MTFPLMLSNEKQHNQIKKNLTTTGAWSFNAGRSDSRRHAGVDLYSPTYTEVISIHKGIVRNIKLFYRNTYAIEIENKTILYRYCEIIPVLDLKAGDTVEEGQIIGYIAQIDSINITMLHLEMYSQAAKGELTNKKNKPFLRRSDLIDPTYKLKELYDNTYR